MQLAVGSAFRNSGPNVPRYMERVKALETMLRPMGHTVRVIAVEGDSTDNTRAAIAASAFYLDLDVMLVTCDHGGPVFGSVESDARFVALSKVGNAILDGVRPGDDALFYVESDLIWEPTVPVNLWKDLVGSNYDVVAPLVMAGEVFYDIWGFRGLDGRRFSPFAPHYPGLLDTVGLFEVGSVGSCFVTDGVVARNARIRNNYCLVGWSQDVRSLGWRIGVDHTQKVHQI